MNFYVASGLINRERVAQVVEWLKARGGTPAYDWTRHGDVRSQGEERMQAVSQNEVNAVCESDLVLALLPGGKGTHIELGIALATRANKRILLWSETGAEFGGGQDTCVFYHHPALTRIVCPFDALPAQLQLALCGKA